MTIYWATLQGAIRQATSEIPNPLPPHLKNLIPLDSNEHGAPESGRQLWDGSKWLPLDPLDIPPTETEMLEALLEAVSVPAGPAGDKLRDVLQRLGR